MNHKGEIVTYITPQLRDIWKAVLDTVSDEMSKLLGTNAKVLINKVRRGRLHKEEPPRRQDTNSDWEFYKLEDWQVHVSVYRNIDSSEPYIPATISFNADAFIYLPHFFLEIHALWIKKVQVQFYTTPVAFFPIGGIPLLYGEKTSYKHVIVNENAAYMLAKLLTHIAVRGYSDLERWINDFFLLLDTYLQKLPPITLRHQGCTVEVMVTLLPNTLRIKVTDPSQWGRTTIEEVDAETDCNLTLRVTNNEGKVFTFTTSTTKNLFKLNVQFRYPTNLEVGKKVSIKIEIMLHYHLEIAGDTYTPPWNYLPREILLDAEYTLKDTTIHLPTPATVLTEKDVKELLDRIRIWMRADVLDEIVAAVSE